MSAKSATVARPRYPSGIPYIIGNEACERFSYYGMRAILVVFMTETLRYQAAEAKATYHYFIMACYFLPLLGGYLADRYWGKYKTIMLLSLFYCAGHGALAIWENTFGLYLGLGLIALGAGGIKPCVSAHVGDQFDESNKSLLDKIFSIFYFSINFGAFFSSVLTPVLLVKYGPGWAFGVPGILMALATFMFWLGRHKFISVPPTGKDGPAGYGAIMTHAIKRKLSGKAPKGKFLDAALDRFSREEVEAVRAANGVFKVFAAVTVFWALFDQQGSSWTLQAQQMDLNVLGFQLEGSQIQAANPILVMLLIPLFSYGIYPAIEKLGFKMTPLRKMSIGMLSAGASFAMMGYLQTIVDSGVKLSVAWQFIPYFAITASEVMVSITGLEFAYTQAPRSMKSTIMSFWLLTVAFGNMLAGIVSSLNKFTGPGEFYFYAGLMAVVSLIFVYNAARYQVREYIEKKTGGGGVAPEASPA